MRHRSRPGFRCPDCRMRCDLCFCSHIQAIQTATKVVLVVHRVESLKPTNTAWLANKMLATSEMRIVGNPHEVPELTTSVQEGTTPLVLFPEPSSPVLDEDFVVSLGTAVTLFVPDGTWKQARKMAHRLPSLRGIRRVRLAPSAASQYLLRRNQTEGGLCTLEAVAQALRVLEGPETAQLLEQSLARMVERVLWSRRTSKSFSETLNALPSVPSESFD